MRTPEEIAITSQLIIPVRMRQQKFRMGKEDRQNRLKACDAGGNSERPT